MNSKRKKGRKEESERKRRRKYWAEVCMCECVFIIEKGRKKKSRNREK